VIFNRLQSSDEFSLYYNESNSTSTNTQSYNSGVGAGFRSSNSIYLNKAKTFRGGIDFSYQFPYTSGLNNINSYYYLDLSAGYVLLNKKLQLSASARDIFKTKNVESSTTVNNIEIVSLANNDSRRFIFSARYSFGNSKLRRGQSHVVSGTEQSRAGN
jgi:hypothetical protein